MNPQQQSALLLFCIAGLLIAMSPSAAAQPTAGECRDATITQGVSTRDRIDLQQDGRSLLIDIRRLTGIGRLKLQPSAPGCLASVVIRLHDFQELESLRIRTPDAALACDQMRVEGKAPRLVCRMGQRQIDAARRNPDHVEVSLPPALLEGGGPVEIHWVDQWR
jgi:hypothetical protein